MLLFLSYAKRYNNNNNKFEKKTFPWGNVLGDGQALVQYTPFDCVPPKKENQGSNNKEIKLQGHSGSCFAFWSIFALLLTFCLYHVRHSFAPDDSGFCEVSRFNVNPEIPKTISHKISYIDHGVISYVNKFWNICTDITLSVHTVIGHRLATII